MDPVRFDRLAKFAARRPSRRALLGALGSGVLTALGGGTGAAQPGILSCQSDVQCPPPLVCLNRACRPLCDRKRCFGRDCIVCLTDDPDFNEDFVYGRFVDCVNDKAFCEGRTQSCCEFCAAWADESCRCCARGRR